MSAAVRSHLDTKDRLLSWCYVDELGFVAG